MHQARSALSAVDHPLIATRDLEAARRAYERLGFVTTPRGRHRGWGTANYCVMFENDYLELLGVVDPRAFTNGLAERLKAEGEGGLAVALRSENAEATRAFWEASGVEVGRVERLGRELECETGVEFLEFDIVRPAVDACAGAPVFACRHATAEKMRKPAWTTHPNGVVGLASITWRAPDPSVVARAWERLFGSSRITETDGVIAAHLGGAALICASADTLSLMDASILDWGFEPPAADGRPEMVRIGYRCVDLAAAATLLRAGGVDHQWEGAAELVVGPEFGHGVFTVFERDAGTL